MPDASLGGRDTHPVTIRELLSGHQMLTIPPLHSSLTEWNVGCLCGWEHKAPDALHGYAAYATHLSERMYAAISELDAAERCGTGIQSSKTLDELIECRLVPDPVASSPGAPRSNT